MNDFYYSLRYVWVTKTDNNTLSQGVFVYCYKISVGDENISSFISFIDDNVLSCIKSHFDDAKLETQNILVDSSWNKWIGILQKKPVQFELIPTFSEKDPSFKNFQSESIDYPSIPISFYPVSTPYKEDPSFPFNIVEFRYSITFTAEFNDFIEKLKTFLDGHFCSFAKACPFR